MAEAERRVGKRLASGGLLIEFLHHHELYPVGDAQFACDVCHALYPVGSSTLFCSECCWCVCQRCIPITFKPEWHSHRLSKLEEAREYFACSMCMRVFPPPTRSRRCNVCPDFVLCEHCIRDREPPTGPAFPVACKGDGTCGCCRKPFNRGEDAVIAPVCEHMFHDECLSAAMRDAGYERKVCPVEDCGELLVDDENL